MISTGFYVRKHVALLAACCLPWLVVDDACAQRYEQMRSINPNEARVIAGRVSATLRGATTLSDAQKKELAKYFMGYYFPAMTKTDAASLGELADMRQKLFSQYIDFANSPQVRTEVIDMTYKAMARIAMGNYHPAARYNAVLAIGMLDDKPATRGATPTPPTPLPKATKALLAVLTQDEIKIGDKTVKVPVSAKVGALVGLERHARFGISEQYAEQVTQATLAIIEQQQPPEDVSRGVHHWMKCQAARVLANQYSEGITSAVHEALLSLVSDEEMSLDDRVCVVQLLQKIKYEGVADIDADNSAWLLGQLAERVVSRSAKESQDYLDELVQGGGFGAARRGGGYGEFGGGSTANMGPQLEKARMLARMNAIVAGAQSISKLSPEMTDKLTQLFQPMDAVIDTAAKKDVVDTKVARQVINLSDEISKLVASWKPAEPAEAPAEAPADASPADAPVEEVS